ncbi:hypothetical protein [Leptolyngbya ohadii]|uniref:hypothetical protein n=1 Tax=Leptolyngbya ohadii TaxID=1962290 RepID=UPI000B5A0AA2|nr:hypothetical protein [Leptolyngbya ohadii]
MAATLVNSTVVLTLFLLTVMIGAGIGSAAWGYRTGRDALKGITQPDARPVNSAPDTQAKPARGEGITLLKEEDILKQVKDKIESGNPNP